MRGFDIVFPREYLRAALMVSLMSVWVLVGLFYYLNRYTKRTYFTIWTAAWLFYALWLTMGITMPNATPQSFTDISRQWCVSLSAVFLLWGSLSFLGIHARQMLFGLFIVFLLTWSYVGAQITDDPFLMQLPLFVLIGLASMFAGVSFYRERQRRRFVGVGMLFLGFLLWGFYLVMYPFSQKYEALITAGFLFSAVLQLFIAVSMIVLVLEEARYLNDEMLAQIHSVNSEKQVLELKVVSSEEQCRSLFQAARLRDELQEAYESLRQTQQSVVQQERLRALGQMASGVAHDVNNALSPIVAYSQLLLDTLPDLAETPQRYLETIKQAGDDVSKIVARMREFYRRRSDTEHLTKVDVNEVMEQVIDLTRPRWRDISQREGISIHIQREMEPNLPRLMSEPTDLREALINLVFNAIDALPQGGTITLATRSVDRPAAEFNGVNQQDIQVEVRDDGVGMDEKLRHRCLEPFFSTKTQRGGSGLGLSMVYGMMQRHSGTIEIESAPGRGTCVLLTFPNEKKDLQAVPVVAPQVQQNRSLHILCIDDEPPVRELMKDCLEHFKHRVEVAATGKEGIELFRTAAQTNEPYDVVITDLGMPEMDGRQVAQTIKAESPQTPVILMTGWGKTMKQDEEPVSNIDAVVSKPPHIRELNDLLSRLAAQQTTETGFFRALRNRLQQVGPQPSRGTPEGEPSHGVPTACTAIPS